MYPDAKFSRVINSLCSKILHFQEVFKVDEWRMPRQHRTRDWFSGPQGRASRRRLLIVHEKKSPPKPQQCLAYFLQRKRATRDICTVCEVSICDTCWSHFHDRLNLKDRIWFNNLSFPQGHGPRTRTDALLHSATSSTNS